MILLFSIFSQWFSRGCLLRCCLGQEKWEMFLIAFLIGMAVGSPVQGYMSDKSSRKKILLVTISCVILSLLIVFIGQSICPSDYFPILLIVASVINGVFGNVFPVAAAAYSEVIEDNQKALQHSIICKYGALLLPFLLRFLHFYSFLFALALNIGSLSVIILKFKGKALAKK